MGKRKLDLMLKVDALTALTAVKNFFTLRELSEVISRPKSVISRYVSGDMAPSRQTAEEIVNALTKNSFARHYVGKALRKVRWDLNSLLLNSMFLTYIGLYFRYELLKAVAGSRLDLIIVCGDSSALLASGIIPYLRVRVTYLETLREEMTRMGKELKASVSSAVIATFLDKRTAEELKDLQGRVRLRLIVVEALIVEDPEGLKDLLSGTKLIYIIP